MMRGQFIGMPREASEEGEEYQKAWSWRIMKEI